MKLVSFVIPCYCSEKTIASVLDEIRGAMQGLPQYAYEVILVNDGSPDNTFETLRALANSDCHVTAIDLARNFGQQSAIMAGLSHSSGDYVVCLDDDGQTPADEVGKLLQKLEEGYDVVYASYEHKQHSWFRNWGSRVNGKMTEIMLGKPKNLALTSYFAVKRFIVLEMLKYKHSFPYSEGLVLRSTRRICNVPVHHRQRQEGTSGYTLGKLIALWMNGFTSFSVKPLRLATYLGALSALLGFLYAIVIVIKHFVDSSIPEGWSSTMALQLVMGGIILVVLGLIGEYIGRIYICINASPQFVEREIVKKEELEN
ncbi:MAG: glycosyltransferase family 2 protein [Candidatus Limivicinus sp.]